MLAYVHLKLLKSGKCIFVVIFFSIFFHVLVYVVSIWVNTYMYTGACVEAEVAVLFNHSPYYLQRHSHLLIPELISSANLARQLAPKILCLHL